MNSRLVAFLRGINVGGHRVKMERLRALFEELGFGNVSTFIASGNVVFNAPRVHGVETERRIEGQLRAALGYEVATFLRTPEELATIVAFRPFGAADLVAAEHTLHVGFLRDAPSKATAKALTALATKMDAFRVRGRELYWLCRGKTSESLVRWRAVDKQLAMSATLRNIKMLRKLATRLATLRTADQV